VWEKGVKKSCTPAKKKGKHVFALGEKGRTMRWVKEINFSLKTLSETRTFPPKKMVVKCEDKLLGLRKRKRERKRKASRCKNTTRKRGSEGGQATLATARSHLRGRRSSLRSKKKNKKLSGD